jgi:hypothetical protein
MTWVMVDDSPLFTIGGSMPSEPGLSPGAMTGSAVTRRRLATISVSNPFLFRLKVSFVDFMVIPILHKPLIFKVFVHRV